MGSGAKRWRGVNGARGKGIGERKGGAGRKRRRDGGFIRVVGMLGGGEVCGLAQKSGVGLSRCKWIEREAGEQSLLWLP